MTLKYRNFKAWIYCENDGKILEEYQARPDPEDNMVYTCWVASEAGKRFTIQWEGLVKSDGDNRGVVFVDGVEVNSYVNTMASNKGGVSSGVKTATGELRPYSFSNVILTDDDKYLEVEQSTNTGELGNITLKIYPVRTYYKSIRHRHRLRHPRQRPEITLYDGAIHESTKKICNHRITLGEAITLGRPLSNRPRSRELVWEPRDRRDSVSCVVFRFKYRPRAFLQAQGIIPSPTCVEATSRKPVIDIDSLSYATGREVQRKCKRRHIDQDPSHQSINNGCSSSELPLFLPAPSPRGVSRTPHCVNNVRAVYFETPRAMKQSKDLVVSGLSEVTLSHKPLSMQDENANSPLSKRTKLEPTTPVKIENEICFWIDDHGVIDLTMDD
ncbi:hypothetical protein ACEPAG_2824 [Sanghuangporus baumii]